MSYRYSRYISRITRQPWAILPETGLIIADLLRERAAGQKPTDEEIAARLGAERMTTPSQNAVVPTQIAVIPIHGVIAHRADSFEASSGGTSAERIGVYLQRALQDDAVKTIVLDFDSPGGSVEGVPELATQIAKGAAIKPIVAHVNALAASAAYWLASQATEIAMTPSGMAGSIGVFMILVDESKALEEEGVVINAISAGDYKLEGAWWAPLSDESRAFYQTQVDSVYRDFLAAVAKGRGVNVSDVKKTYGQGRVFDAKEALARGMVDRIATMDDTLARLVHPKTIVRRAIAQTQYMGIGLRQPGADALVFGDLFTDPPFPTCQPVSTPFLSPPPSPVKVLRKALTDDEVVAAEHQAIAAALQD